ncbi:MAG: flagellin, partial [Pseudomonadota bacterium]
MGSILTNNSAMVALQTLNNINRNLGEVQSQISTGFEVGSAKDNAAVFAISQVMRSDVAGFEAISESLSLGESTVAVASNAANATADLLNEIKGKIVAASEDNVDRQSLQDEIVSLRDQIAGVVGAAQFNGLNLLSNTDTTADSGTSSVLASLDRGSDQSVTTADISVGKQDLGTSAATANFTTSANAGATAAVNDGATGNFADFAATTVNAGQSFRLVLGTNLGLAAAENIDVVARDGDTIADVTAALTAKANFTLLNAGIDADTASFAVNATDATQIDLTNNTGANITPGATAALEDAAGSTSGTIGGGLELLAQIDVSTEDGANAALVAIEDLIQTTIGAQAALGTSEKRIEIQNDFMGTLIDSFKSGIGSLVDADLE